MKILLAASEVAPLAKTGGLADVASALPKALHHRGHDIAVIMPFYSSIDQKKLRLELIIPEIHISLPTGHRAPALWKASLLDALPSEQPTLYLIEDRGLFRRTQLYGGKNGDYADNALRFAYFTLAALWALKGINWIPDIIHANDWQTALFPTYLKFHSEISKDPELSKIATLFSIHNISYQGVFPEHTGTQIKLPPSLMEQAAMEFHGWLNLLKGGILYSDALTTVSPRYAFEIQSSQLGCGLEGLLRNQAHKLHGILNGIDTDIWNPQTDPALPAHFNRQNLDGKAECKRILQKKFGLPERSQPPILAFIGRMVPQKGIDLIASIARELFLSDVQLILLGTGLTEYQNFFLSLAAERPMQCGVQIGFDDSLAHLIEAGADIFLMPSHYEPCGLNQLYSLRYGTIPIVRYTGGLADSIIDMSQDKATGIVFDEYSAQALMHAINRALYLYWNEPQHWAGLRDHAMQQDFSWNRSAEQYEQLMLQVLKHRASEPHHG